MRPQPPRLTEQQLKRERQSARCGDVPTTVLSLWQPLASFLAHGIQRVEGRGWSTEFRGPLWIHAGSKQVSAEDIARWEGLYRDFHAKDGNADVVLPSSYPTSALVGLVEVVDVVAADDFRSWRTLPPGLRREGRYHGSGSLFLIEGHKRLPLPIKMSGQHKFWRLDRQMAARGLTGLEPSAQTPVHFAPHRELAAQAAEACPVRRCDDGTDSDAESCARGESDSDTEAERLEAMQMEIALRLSAAQASDDANRRLGAGDGGPVASPSEARCCGGEEPRRTTPIDQQGFAEASAATVDMGAASTEPEPARRGRWRRAKPAG